MDDFEYEDAQWMEFEDVFEYVYDQKFMDTLQWIHELPGIEDYK